MDGTEQRILEASIAAIEEFGFNNVTVRRIAARAGVNIAAINYHFRSKDQLLEKVLEMTVDNAFDWGELAHTESLPPKEQLFAVMDHLSRGAQNYPETTRAYFFETMVNGRSDTRAIHVINGFMESLCQKLIDKGCRMNEKDLRTSVTQIFMACLFPVGVTPNVYDQFLRADLTKDYERKKFIRSMVDKLIVD